MIWEVTLFVGVWFVLPVVLRATVFRARYCTSKKRLDGKVALVTGANTGLGKYSALDLARRGAKVYMACRDMKKAERARQDILAECPNAKLVLLSIDLASLNSTRECASSFLKEESRLDILMDNAGFGSFEHRKTVEGIEWHLGCNHLAHFLLTRLLLPVLEKTGSSNAKSRIVVLSSYAHDAGGTIKRIDYDKLQAGEAKYSAYGQSKLANLLFTRKLAQLLSSGGRNITVNGIHPGACSTEFVRYLLPGIYWHLVKLATFPTYYTLCNTSEEGAQSQIYVAVDEAMEGVSGKYISKCLISKPSAAAEDDKQADELWTWSCKQTGLPEKLEELPSFL